MEVSLTKMSPNGQVVIPAEIRRDASIKPSAQFIVFNDGKDIILKRIERAALQKKAELIKSLLRSELDYRKGKVRKANASMSPKEIDYMLMK